jgi:fumarate reductase subunit C
MSHMSHKGGSGKAYVRPMHGWWRRDPFFVRYMAREVTAVAVLAYAIVLAVGVVRLAQGEAAWNGWLQALRSPWSLLLHAVLLVAMFVHAKSWFEIMPKTMPMMVVGGRRVSAATITRSGWAATIVASLVLLMIAWWLRP